MEGEGKAKDPLHGVTLKAMLEALVEKIGWEALADKIRIRCFERDPSVASSLAFLRKTPWAREKVENLYAWVVHRRALHSKAAREDAEGLRRKERRARDFADSSDS